MKRIYCIMLTNCATKELLDITHDAINSTMEQKKCSVSLVRIETQSEKYLKEMFGQIGYLNTVFPNEPFNYNKFLQLGLRYYNSQLHDYILILNNDVIWNDPYSLVQMCRIIDEGYADSVSPCNPNIPEHNIKTELFGFRPYYNLCGWAILFDPTILYSIPKEKLFDNRLVFWYQDNLYGYLLEKYGFRHCLTPKAKLIHYESKSKEYAKSDWFEQQKTIYENIIKEYQNAR